MENTNGFQTGAAFINMCAAHLYRWVILSLALLGNGLDLPGQEKTFSSLTRYERRWAIFHPFSACRIKRHQKEMYEVYQEVKNSAVLDSYSNGGKLDAFRHAFAMAYFVRYVTVRKLRRLGKAHEKGNYYHFKKGIAEEGELPDSVATAMDLFNNELGFRIGCNFRYVSMSDLKEKVITQITEGGALIVKRNKEGAYLDCQGSVIPPEKIKGVWNTPKCLVRSE